MSIAGCQSRDGTWMVALGGAFCIHVCIFGGLQSVISVFCRICSSRSFGAFCHWRLKARVAYNILQGFALAALRSNDGPRGRACYFQARSGFPSKVGCASEQNQPVLESWVPSSSAKSGFCALVLGMSGEARLQTDAFPNQRFQSVMIDCIL